MFIAVRTDGDMTWRLSEQRLADGLARMRADNTFQIRIDMARSVTLQVYVGATGMNADPVTAPELRHTSAWSLRRVTVVQLLQKGSQLPVHFGDAGTKSGPLPAAQMATLVVAVPVLIQNPNM